MEPWVLFVIAAVAIFVGSIFRGPRARQRPFGSPPDEADAGRTRRSEPPPLPRRRLMQPQPVSRAVAVAQQPRPEAPRVEVVPVLPVATKVETKQVSTSVTQVLALLKHQQTLRTAVILREVLDPPLCRRRRLR
jgi:hypothetical protein